MQRNTICLFLLSINLLTFTPHRAYCSSSLEDSGLNKFEKNCIQEKIKKFKLIIASLTPQNVDQAIFKNGYFGTPLQILASDQTYHESMSPQEYEQHVDLLLELGADPCAESAKNWVLIHIASQGNYTIFKKIVSHIAPKDFNSKLFKTTIIDMFAMNMQKIRRTPDTLQILTDLIDLGADIHAQDRKQQTVLFCHRNTPETLQFFLDRGVDPSKKDCVGRTCFHRHQTVDFANTQDLVKTLRLHQAFDSYHIKKHADGTTSPGWKDTLFGKIFVHACLECFKGNPELIKTIVIQASKKTPKLAGTLEKLLKQNAWPEFLIPAITSQLPKDEHEQFLAQVHKNLKMTVDAQEKLEKFKKILVSLTPQNVNAIFKMDTYSTTPLVELTTDDTYHEHMSSQEYEQHIDHLLALGADPCTESIRDRDLILASVASQGNYRIFKKIFAHIAPEHINSGTFKTTLHFMFTDEIFRIKYTPDTLQILTDLVNLGADIHAQNFLQQTILFSGCNTPETLQFFLDLGVDPSKKNGGDKTCLQHLDYILAYPSKFSFKRSALISTLLLNQAFDSYHIKKHADGTTSPGWKDTLLGKTFIHACLECFNGNPELLHVIQSNKKASLAGKLEKLLKQDAWPEILIPAITFQLPEDEQEFFLAQVPNNLNMTVAELYQANQESPE